MPRSKNHHMKRPQAMPPSDSATMASITRQMSLYRDELARLGKPLPRVRPLIKEIYCAKDRRTALELAGPHLGAKYRAYASWGQDAVLHLACISNDASFELDENLSKSINYDCFEPMVMAAKKAGVNNYIVKPFNAAILKAKIDAIFGA